MELPPPWHMFTAMSQPHLGRKVPWQPGLVSDTADSVPHWLRSGTAVGRPCSGRAALPAPASSAGGRRARSTPRTRGGGHRAAQSRSQRLLRRCQAASNIAWVRSGLVAGCGKTVLAAEAVLVTPKAGGRRAWQRRSSL